MRIDEFATHELNGIHYRVGRPLPFGATLIDDGTVNFSVSSANAKSCTLVLFHRGENEPFIEIPFPGDFNIGDNYSMMVFDLNIEELE